MPQLLLELFSEEIPARMQAQAARDLERLIVGGLTERGFLNEGARGFATPRRLTLVIEGLPAEQADMREERKGPKVDAPDQAIQGFLRSTGLTRDQLKVQKDSKGDFYLAVTERKGRPTPDVLAELIPDVIKAFPWPKSQRWGSGELTWVRPLHSILCTFDGEIVPFTVGTVKSGNATRGHRFLGNDKFEVRRFDDYVDKLKRNHVILNAAERKAAILHEAKQLAHAQNLSLIEDDTLADEVAGLVEWPVALIGQFDKPFLDVPQEILISTMRANQKYFALKDPQTGKLANKFVVIANMVTNDGGKNIVAGNERVLRARLSDAKFFWDQDKKTTLESRVPQLKDIVFHAKLGTLYARSSRLVELAGQLAGQIGGDRSKARRAARLCKADLVSGTVGEFPEVQGVMGRYFAIHDGEAVEVADAIRDHYKPLGQGDDVPAAPVSIALGLADKLDTLAGFFGVGERPTGSGDPFALRRAALGFVRTALSNSCRLSLRPTLKTAYLLHLNRQEFEASDNFEPILDSDEIICADVEEIVRLGPEFALFECGGLWADVRRILVDPKRSHEEKRDAVARLDERAHTISRYRHAERMSEGIRENDGKFTTELPNGQVIVLEREVAERAREQYQRALETLEPMLSETADRCLSFIVDRLKIALRDQGVRHDLIDAVFALGGQDDLVLIVKRVKALQVFLSSDDGANLLAGYRRAVNILKIEEKRDGRSYDSDVDPMRLGDDEMALFLSTRAAKAELQEYLDAEKFDQAMRWLAGLRSQVDHFFEKVTVNDKDPQLRMNRLKMLTQIRAAMHTVADFSKIEG